MMVDYLRTIRLSRSKAEKKQQSPKIPGDKKNIKQETGPLTHTLKLQSWSRTAVQLRPAFISCDASALTTGQCHKERGWRC